MPQTEQDLEEGRNTGPVDGHRDQPQSTMDQPSPPWQGEFSYGNSSRPLYSMYCKIAEEEDNKFVDSLQKGADGNLVFIGLFAATVGALLTVSIPDLKPNPQDTSAFYLKNIYQLQALGDPNVSHPSIPSALAEPPVFSPPKYAIWVNSFWFLSLVVTLWAAITTMMSRDWALLYDVFTQSHGYTSEKHARRRAVFARRKFGPYFRWEAGLGDIYLHFSFFLFIVGGLIYLFNINRAVFYAVVWWVGYMTISYGGASVAGFFKPQAHDLLFTPLSRVVLRIYLGILYAVFQVSSCMPPLLGLHDNMKTHYRGLSDCYSKGLLFGKLKIADEDASKQSSEIDGQILEGILPHLDEDHALETFFAAIPGYCNSKLTVLPLPSLVRYDLQQSLDGFLKRTFSSSLISESDRTRRLITCLHAACAALSPEEVSRSLDYIFDGHWDEALQFFEIWDTLKPCGLSRNRDLSVRQTAVACVIHKIIPRVHERDERWTKLVKETFGVPDLVLDYYGDSVLLWILIHISRQINRYGFPSWQILSPLSSFDIRNTHPELQLDFYAMWNEIARDTQHEGSHIVRIRILNEIRHLYIALRQSTDAAPAAFPASANDFDRDPPDSPSHHSTSGGGTVLQQVREATAIAGPPSPSDPTSLSEIRDSSQAPAAVSPTLPVHTSPRPTDETPDTVAVALKGVPPAATLSDPLEGTTQQDIVMPCAEPDIGEVLSLACTPAPTPTLASAPSYGAGSASTPNPLLPASSIVGFSTPASPPQSRVTPLPDTEFLALPSSATVAATPPRPTSNTTLSRPRVRELANSGSMCFANAMLQLLVHSPPFWNLFRELGDLKGQRGAGDPETGGGATPLVDATLRFFEELRFKEPLPTRQQAQQAARGKTREDEEAKKHDAVDSLEPMYLYDAMKEKRKLKDLLNGQQQDAEEFFRLYLDALDEELRALLASISGHKSAAVTPGVEDREMSQSDQTDVGKRGFTTSSAESPISRIFDGRSRSTVCAPNQPDSITVQDWRLLQLNIQPDLVHSIKDALVHISQPQPVQVGQLSPSEVTQQVQIEALPPILVLHLKRFLYDAAADSLVKISKPIQFAPELEIPFEIMAPVTRKSAEPVHYKLYGVLYHHGESAGSGHYTVDVLHPNGDSGSEEAWLHIDDEAVSAVRHEDVFRGHENEQVGNRCAYMLFYCRTGPTQT